MNTKLTTSLAKKTKSQIGKRARAKGQQFQRDIANTLAVVYCWAKSASQYLGGKREGSDVQGTPYFVECKDTATISIPQWWKQAEDDKKALDCDDEIALVFKLRGKPLVCITLEEFVRLQRVETGRVRRAWEGGVHSVETARAVLGQIVPYGDKFAAVGISETLTNQRKGSGGLWSTLDAAEAALRRSAE